MFIILTYILNIFDGLFETIVIFLFFKEFIGVPKFRNMFTFVLVFVLTAIVTFINTSNLPEIISLVSFTCYSLSMPYLFKGTWQKRVQATMFLILSLLVTSILVSIIVDFLTYNLPIPLADGNYIINFTHYISGLFLFLILTLVVKYKQREKSFISFGFYVFLLIPLTWLSIICLYHLTIMNHSHQQIANLLYTFAIVGVFYLNFIVLYLVDNTLKRYKLSNEIQLLTQQINYQVQNYEQLIDSQQEIRKIKHDMKIHLISLNHSAKRNNCVEIENYITPLLVSLDETSEIVTSGNMTIDALLNYFSYLCKCENIQLTIEVPTLQIRNISHTDLCIVLGNAMTNAIEACEQLKDEKKRFINVSIYINKSYLIIDILNSRKEETLSQNFPTTKQNKKNHGFGLQNIKNVISKYEGNLQLSPTTDTFHFSAVLKNN